MAHSDGMADLVKRDARKISPAALVNLIWVHAFHFKRLADHRVIHKLRHVHVVVGEELEPLFLIFANSAGSILVMAAY